MIVAMIGGLLGFFVFNHKPAKVFMGDNKVASPWRDVGGYFHGTSPRMDATFDWSSVCL